jgi:membrane protein CcdC involved in cytochrome C biogenesis
LGGFISQWIFKQSENEPVLITMFIISSRGFVINGTHIFSKRKAEIPAIQIDFLLSKLPIILSKSSSVTSGR